LDIAKAGAETAAPNGVADWLVMRGSASAGMTLLTNTTGQNNIFFGDTDNQTTGRIQYLHDVDAMRFNVNASERLRITSDGRLGLGTSSPGANLELGPVSATEGPTLRLSAGAGGAGAIPQYPYGTLQFYSADSSGDGPAVKASIAGVADTVSAAPGGILTFSTYPITTGSLTERMRIDSSGRVGIGTTTVDNKLQVVGDVGIGDIGTSGTYDLYWAPNTAGGSVRWFRSEGSAFSLGIGATAGTTEQLRVDGSGRLLVGTTTLVSGISSAFGVLGSGAAATFQGGGVAGQQTVYIHHTATSGDNLFLEFGTEASRNTRGSVDYNRSAGQVRYNVTSDRRLKSNIEDASSALSVLDQIKVRSYTWTETGYNISYGFIAQELNEAVPDAVKVGDDGDEVVDIWAVDNAKLVPLLTKALQEMIAELQTLKAEVAALKAS
jgi:hypothetical protein